MRERRCLSCREPLVEGSHPNRKRCPSCAQNHLKKRDRATKGVQLAPDAITCPVCGGKFNCITAGHYRKHGFEDARSFKQAHGLETLKAPSISRKHSSFMVENSPTKGRQRTKEEKDEMSVARKGKGIGVAGKYERTPEIRAKISEGVTRFQQENPGFHLSWFQAGWVFSAKADREVFYRSSWELRVIQVLDRQGKGLTSFEVEPVAIPYEFEGVTHQYLPDFLLTYEGEMKELWEVKPALLIHTDRNQAKFAAARKWASQHNMGFRLVTLPMIERMERKTLLSELVQAVRVARGTLD